MLQLTVCGPCVCVRVNVLQYVTTEYFLPYQMDIGLLRQILVHTMTLAEVVARVARWIMAWMAYGGVVFVLVALETGLRYIIQVYFGERFPVLHALSALCLCMRTFRQRQKFFL
jgi:hypothetical protein